MTTFLVTGGAGFIGSSVVRLIAANMSNHVVCYDKLTYAGNLESLSSVSAQDNYTFIQGDICNQATFLQALREHEVDIVMNLAAESHVDRSIDGPGEFINTNVVGTFKALEASRAYWLELTGEKRSGFRFHHVSTDEVFGDLPFESGIFTEESPYAPSSPYAASKAASDHLVRAWCETYGLPVVLSNCSNNYGPYHFPEKLIPLMILSALDELPLPVYGKGENVRDWLHVDDHASALVMVATSGGLGESYNIGGNAERRNIDVVRTICEQLDQKHPRKNGKAYADLIEWVDDRPGHDRRYAIDASKIKAELGWVPSRSFEEGLSATIDWYLENAWWWQPIRDGDEGKRLGTLLTHPVQS